MELLAFNHSKKTKGRKTTSSAWAFGGTTRRLGLAQRGLLKTYLGKLVRLPGHLAYLAVFVWRPDQEHVSLGHGKEKESEKITNVEKEKFAKKI